MSTIAAINLKNPSSGSSNIVLDSSGRVLVGTSTARTSSLAELVNGSANTNADYSGAAASFVAPGLVGTTTNPATISVEDNRAMAIDVGGSIGFGGRYLTSSTTYAQWAAVAGKKETGVSSEYGGYLAFYTRTNLSSSIAERTRIDSSGRLLVGTTTANTSGNALLQVNGSIKGTITSGTSVASTSGVSIDFTGIPSWAKRVTVMFNGVSTSGTSQKLVRVGSGSIVTSGYAGNSSFIAAATCGTLAFTDGFNFYNLITAADVINGHLILTNVSDNIWVCSAAVGNSAGTIQAFSTGSVTLSGALDRVRITTVNGTDTFDAGSINLLYEG